MSNPFKIESKTPKNRYQMQHDNNVPSTLVRRIQQQRETRRQAPTSLTISNRLDFRRPLTTATSPVMSDSTIRGQNFGTQTYDV